MKPLNSSLSFITWVQLWQNRLDKALTEFDWVDVNGDLDLAGTLDVQFINGFSLDSLYSFKIINVTGSSVGQFDSLGEGAVVGTFGGADLFISYMGGDGNDIVLYNLTAVPEPGSISLMILGIGCVMLRGRHRSGRLDTRKQQRPGMQNANLR